MHDAFTVYVKQINIFLSLFNQGDLLRDNVGYHKLTYVVYGGNRFGTRVCHWAHGRAMATQLQRT